MSHLLSQCNWPELPEKYDLALREGIEFILERYHVSGIIASGTIIRGNPDPASDLDIYVIHPEPFRQRIQKFFHDIPAEIFVNPPQAVEGYFDEEQSSRSPLTAHMLATGFVVLKLDPVIDELREKARNLLSNPPETPKDLTPQRYYRALLLEDATDLIEKDPATAQMLLSQAVTEMLEFCFIQQGDFIPRPKSLLDKLAKIDSQLADLARSFFEAASLDLRADLACQIADRTIAKRGFFEWETSPETVPS